MLFIILGLKDFSIINCLERCNILLPAVNCRYKCVRPPPIPTHNTNATITIRILHFHHNLFYFSV